jgi:pyruvate-formate lyase-activating enzyme
VGQQWLYERGNAERIFTALDAINVDIKAFDESVHHKYTGAHLQPILENCRLLKKAGIWLEITTLLIPGINDSQEQIEGLAKLIAEELGKIRHGTSAAISHNLSFRRDQLHLQNRF